MTCIFANDLLERGCQDAPREDLDVLFNIARLGVRESHDQLEELLAVGLRFRDGGRTEALQIAPDAVLLFHREADRHQCLEKLDGVDTRDVALVLLGPPDTADANAVRCASFWGDGLEFGGDDASGLATAELHQASPCLPLRCTPAVRHASQLPFDGEVGFCIRRVDGVRVESRNSAGRRCR